MKYTYTPVEECGDYPYTRVTPKLNWAQTVIAVRYMGFMSASHDENSTILKVRHVANVETAISDLKLLLTAIEPVPFRQTRYKFVNAVIRKIANLFIVVKTDNVNC